MNDFDAEYKLRPACENDLQAVFDIFMDESNHPYLLFDPMSVGEFKPVYEGLLSSGEFLVCESDGQVVGTCKIDRNKHKRRYSVYIGLLAVMPDLKGKGAAAFIMRTILTRLEEEGFKRIELHTAEDNKRAIQFFENFGFVVEASLPWFFVRPGDDNFHNSLIMAKIIN